VFDSESERLIFFLITIRKIGFQDNTLFLELNLFLLPSKLKKAYYDIDIVSFNNKDDEDMVIIYRYKNQIRTRKLTQKNLNNYFHQVTIGSGHVRKRRSSTKVNHEDGEDATTTNNLVLFGT